MTENKRFVFIPIDDFVEWVIKKYVLKGEVE